MFSLERKVERAARKGVAFSAAAILAAVGLAFLTTACWFVLSELRSATFAATIIGLFYIGAAAVALAVALKKPDQTHAPTPTSTAQNQATSDLSPLQMVILGFVQGFEQGRERHRKDTT